LPAALAGLPLFSTADYRLMLRQGSCTGLTSGPLSMNLSATCRSGKGWRGMRLEAWTGAFRQRLARPRQAQRPELPNRPCHYSTLSCAALCCAVLCCAGTRCAALVITPRQLQLTCCPVCLSSASTTKPKAPLLRLRTCNQASRALWHRGLATVWWSLRSSCKLLPPAVLCCAVLCHAVLHCTVPWAVAPNPQDALPTAAHSCSDRSQGAPFGSARCRSAGRPSGRYYYSS